ncbi:MAG: hypothetical protein J6M53_04840 [Bacteroidaceae bacterium]|nr:hypothetical protein [Bacteroidaceae bacterium]
MKLMKIWRLAFAMLAAISLASCSSDPEWADPEAHEMTEQLRAQYAALIVGTWHYERTLDRQRVFEQLTFNADGTFSGRRKWQTRSLVTIDGREQYTDWADVADENGTFAGSWSLAWERNSQGVGESRLHLHATWADEGNTTTAYLDNVLFASADEATLQFAGYWKNDGGWTLYERGEAEAGF